MLMPTSWAEAKNKLTDLRIQLILIAVLYAGVFTVSGALLVLRIVWERENPAEASGGMAAAGDLLLWIFFVCLFMVPTAALVWVGAKFESVYTVYSQALLGLSLTAPVSLGLFYLGEKRVWQNLIAFCFVRLAISPFLVAGMGFSRLVARFGRAKRLSVYAFLVEGLTMAACIVLIVRAGSRNPH